MSNVEYLIVRSYKLTQTEFLAEQIEPHNTQRERERERERVWRSKSQHPIGWSV